MPAIDTDVDGSRSARGKLGPGEQEHHYVAEVWGCGKGKGELRRRERLKGGCGAGREDHSEHVFWGASEVRCVVRMGKIRGVRGQRRGRGQETWCLLVRVDAWWKGECFGMFYQLREIIRVMVSKLYR